MAGARPVLARALSILGWPLGSPPQCLCLASVLLLMAIVQVDKAPPSRTHDDPRWCIHPLGSDNRVTFYKAVLHGCRGSKATQGPWDAPRDAHTGPPWSTMAWTSPPWFPWTVEVSPIGFCP